MSCGDVGNVAAIQKGEEEQKMMPREFESGLLLAGHELIGQERGRSAASTRAHVNDVKRPKHSLSSGQ